MFQHSVFEIEVSVWFFLFMFVGNGGSANTIWQFFHYLIKRAMASSLISFILIYVTLLYKILHIFGGL